MFNLERGLRYWLYSEPTDMRKSFHTLSGVVRNKIGGDPMNGAGPEAGSMNDDGSVNADGSVE